MRSSKIRTVLGVLVVSLISPLASQAVEFGKPDNFNYMSRPGLVTCDWRYDSYARACPTPEEPPKAQAPAKATAKAKRG